MTASSIKMPGSSTTTRRRRSRDHAGSMIRASRIGSMNRATIFFVAFSSSRWPKERGGGGGGGRTWDGAQPGAGGASMSPALST